MIQAHRSSLEEGSLSALLNEGGQTPDSSPLKGAAAERIRSEDLP
jgi:hypothetical protein